jgi:glycerophosphoryl diester phosphodiesterase
VSNMGPPSIIAHRGAWTAAGPAENTVGAFERARASGASWVEFDVRRTRDGGTAVHHDARLGDGRVIVTLDRAALPASVPDLAEALAACRGLGVNIEIKNSPGEPDHDAGQWLADLVGATVAPGAPVIVSSFDLATIGHLHARAPHVATAWLTVAVDDPVDVIARCVAGGHCGVHPFEGAIDAAFVERAHAVGLVVNVWTVDDPARMMALASMGVDGICTNRVDLAVDVFARL